jgi:hypothetical protein
MKKILKYEPYEDHIHECIDPPTPGSKHIPDWFKNLAKRIIPNKMPFTPNGNANFTAKACAPLVDSFMAGYTITLPFDVIVTRDKEYKNLFNWQCEWDVVGVHDARQYPKEGIPAGFEGLFKWNNPWILKTPPGYSLWVTHPANRYDLPFITMGGFVDTDEYNISPINFPFFLREDFEGTIKHGTPIAQVIPVKRDSWSLEKLPYNKGDIKTPYIVRKLLEKSYKMQFWNKKDYR